VVLNRNTKIVKSAALMTKSAFSVRILEFAGRRLYNEVMKKE